MEVCFLDKLQEGLFDRKKKPEENKKENESKHREKERSVNIMTAFGEAENPFKKDDVNPFLKFTKSDDIADADYTEIKKNTSDNIYVDAPYRSADKNKDSKQNDNGFHSKGKTEYKDLIPENSTANDQYKYTSDNQDLASDPDLNSNTDIVNNPFKGFTQYEQKSSDGKEQNYSIGSTDKDFISDSSTHKVFDSSGFINNDSASKNFIYKGSGANDYDARSSDIMDSLNQKNTKSKPQANERNKTENEIKDKSNGGDKSRFISEDKNKDVNKVKYAHGQADISMKTRTSKISKLIDFINKNKKVEGPGKQLKNEQSDNLFTDDSPFSTIEDACDFFTDCTEWACESIAFWGKRQCTCLFSSFQNKMMKKKFKRNDNIIRYGDFMFYEMNDELMLFKYVGVDTQIIIPSYVEGYPVKYLEKGFLRFNRIKSVGRGFSTENIQQTSMDSIIDNFFNIKSIQLPDTLAILPSNVFKGCKRIDEIIIPESVEIIQPNAFKGCRPTRLIFLGEAPKQLENCDLSKVKIYCNHEYFDSFYKLIDNYGAYISSENVKKDYLKLKDSMTKIHRTSDVRNYEEIDSYDSNEISNAIKVANSDYNMLLEQHKELMQKLNTLIAEIKNKKRVLNDRVNQYNLIKNHFDSLNTVNSQNVDLERSRTDLEQVKNTCTLLKTELDDLEIKYNKLKRIIKNNEQEMVNKKDLIIKLIDRHKKLQKRGA